MANLSALVIGATGATGSSLVNELLKNANFNKVVTITRRTVDYSQPEAESKLKQIVVDFENMNSIKNQIEPCDVAFSCLGTTKSAAGSKDAFRHIEIDYNVNFAQIAKDSGVKNFHLVSSQMANPKSWFFYIQVKGEIEEKIKEIDFNKLNIWRPGMLDRKDKTRFIEKMTNIFLPSISVDTGK
ncbi:putative transcription coactivator-like protein [Dinothrombium tinctorium]|uniref:Protein HTATIP2 n=1 Tax=Dinothrombium tinctorium TaxID=1965070 RepID=A0A3S3P739_9ACAR|nr:putative transcription coactivator-like protein [Dinothrombium tinctorium]